MVLISAHGINHDFGEPTIPSRVPEQGHIFWCPWVGSKKWQHLRGLILQCGAVAVHNHPLNCHSDGSRRLVSTFFPGRKCPHVCKGICWWEINGFLTHCGKDAVTTSPFVSLFSCAGPCAQLCYLIQSFNSQPLFSCQWLPD